MNCYRYAPTKDNAGENADGDVTMDNANVRKTARDLMWENGGPGVWAPDYREQYDLENDEWKFDAIPQIMDGKNIADYVDPDIEKKLAVLEEEEEQLIAEAEAAAMGRDEESDLDSDEEALVGVIREKVNIIRKHSKANSSTLPRQVRGRMTDCHDLGARNADGIREKMGEYGIDTEKMISRGRSLERKERGRKRERSLARNVSDDDASMDETQTDGMSKTQQKRSKKEKKDKVKREHSLARSHSRPREPSEMGLKDEKAVKKVAKEERLGRKKWIGGSGEGDQRKTVHLVKWMNTGKKRMGTHNKR